MSNHDDNDSNRFWNDFEKSSAVLSAVNCRNDSVQAETRGAHDDNTNRIQDVPSWSGSLRGIDRTETFSANESTTLRETSAIFSDEGNPSVSGSLTGSNGAKNLSICESAVQQETKNIFSDKSSSSYSDIRSVDYNSDISSVGERNMRGNNANLDGSSSVPDILISNSNNVEKVSMNMVSAKNTDNFFRNEGGRYLCGRQVKKSDAIIIFLIIFFGLCAILIPKSSLSTSPKQPLTSSLAPSKSKPVPVESFPSLAPQATDITIVTDSLSLSLEQIGEPITTTTERTNFGYSISLSKPGNMISIGAPFFDGPPGIKSGAVMAYKMMGNEWKQIGSVLYGDDSLDWYGYDEVLSSSGEFLACSGGFGRNSSKHHFIRVYQNMGTEWVKKASDITGAHGIGRDMSLSMDGSRLVVSTSSGVLFYQYDNSLDDWEKFGNEIKEDKMPSVSFSENGERIVIGSPNYTGGIDRNGRVRIFQVDNVNKVLFQAGQPIYGLKPNEQLGYSVSISGNGTVVAAGSFHGNIVRVIHEQITNFETIWTPRGDLILGQDNDKNKFGISLSLAGDGDKLIVGSPLYNAHTGRAVLFQFNESNNSWNQFGEVVGTKKADLEGYDVSMSAEGRHVASSALNGGINGLQSYGRIRLFEIKSV